MVQRTDARPHVVIVGGGFGGLTAAQALANAPGPGDPGRPHESSHLPAAPLPGRHGRPVPGRDRAADPLASFATSATPRSSWSRSPRIDADAAALAPERRDIPRLGLSHRGLRRGDVVFRSRRLGARRARAQVHRGCHRDPPARALFLRAGGARAQRGATRGASQLRGHRRRAHRRRARGRPGGALQVRARSRLPPRRSVARRRFACWRAVRASCRRSPKTSPRAPSHSCTSWGWRWRPARV